MSELAFKNAAMLRRIALTDRPITMIKDLATELSRDPANTRRALELLRAEGLVERPNPLAKHDTLALTDLGRQVLAGINVAEGKRPATIFEPAPAAELSGLPSWPLDRIIPNPANRRVDPAGIPGMADSLVENGQQTPVTLTPVRDDGNRMLLIGERRWMGACMARDQGRLPDSLKDGLRFEERDATEAEAVGIMLVENSEREDMTPLDKAFALRRFSDLNGEPGKPLDGKAVAERLGFGVRDTQVKLQIARKATPEALAQYAEDGNWDRLLDSTRIERPKAEDVAPQAPTADRKFIAADFGVPGDFRAHKAELTREEGVARARHWIDLDSFETLALPQRAGAKDHGFPRAQIQIARIRESNGWVSQGGYSFGGIGHHQNLAGVFSGDGPAFGSRAAAIRDAAEMILSSGAQGDKGVPADVRTWLDGLMGENDPLVINGIRYPNATRANEAKRIAGLIPNPSNSGGGKSLKTVLENLAKGEPAIEDSGWVDGITGTGPIGADGFRQLTPSSGSAQAVEDGHPALLTDPTPGGSTSSFARLALLEIAHKVGAQRRPLDPISPAEWTGDPAADFLTHGCTCGAHWLDSRVQALVADGYVHVVQIPGGPPPMLALLPKAVAWFEASDEYALPVTDARLTHRQKFDLGPGGCRALGGQYATESLRIEAPQAAGADPAAAAPDPDPDQTSLVDLWDRDADQIAADDALLERVKAFADPDRDPRPGDTAASLLRELGANPYAEATDAGGVFLGTPDGPRELITIDAGGSLPDSRAAAFAWLVAWAIETAIGGEAN